jgi:hypothetical protein
MCTLVSLALHGLQPMQSEGNPRAREFLHQGFGSREFQRDCYGSETCLKRNAPTVGDAPPAPGG